jgi:selenide, water dikinase
VISAAGPVLKDVVLLGAGHAHVGVLRMFAMDPLPGLRFTLITREVHTPYSGMLPGLIAGRYGFDDAHIDTGPLAHFAGARLYRDEAIGLDLEGHRVMCRDRPPVPYDYLSIDIGSTPNVGAVPGAAQHAIPVKPIDGFLSRFEALRARVLAADRPVVIGVVGAGAGGVELMLSVERRLRRDVAALGRDPGALSFALIAGSEDILPSFPRAMAHRFRAACAGRGIRVVTGARVMLVEAGKLRLETGETIALDEILWTTQAAAAPWLRDTGLTLDRHGFISVTPTLNSLSHGHVFAAGDIASIDGHALPKSGVYAVRQGPALARNIRRLVTGRKPLPYRPQRDALYLVTTGDDVAIGSRNGVTFGGRWVWRLKDFIDRRFMRKFNELPDMAGVPGRSQSPIADAEAIKEISAIAMRCGGCGAKVGATVLSRALRQLVPAQRDDVVVGLDAPDDAAIVDTGGPQLSVQTVDYFRAMIDDPFLFGKIAANHALGDLYAMGGMPQTALAIATVPYGLEAKVEEDLSLMMAGANDVLREAGCALVGGHTSEGAELALGFAVNGLVGRDAALRKDGMRPGDALILTKPIGTGTLLAADMRGKAKARWIDAAITHMCVSNREAAAVLVRRDAHAATDVTGFGLLGHLVEMVRASDVDVTLALDRIPVLEGARDTIRLGVFSSLQPQNVRLRRAIRNHDAAAAHPDYPLLFDPQTAGGLLAAVPAAQAQDCIAELRRSGYRRAAVIGLVGVRGDRLEPLEIVSSADGLGIDEAPLTGADHAIPRGGRHAYEPVP